VPPLNQTVGRRRGYLTSYLRFCATFVCAAITIGTAAPLAGAESAEALQSPIAEHHPPPSDPLCFDMTGGWVCQYKADERPPPSDLQTLLSKFRRFEEVCKSQGGRWRCSGFCDYWYPRWCQYPLPDAGKPCSDASECIDKCVIEFDRSNPHEGELCKKSCRGQCSEYVKHQCDRYYEVVHGTSKPHLLICD